MALLLSRPLAAYPHAGCRLRARVAALVLVAQVAAHAAAQGGVGLSFLSGPTVSAAFSAARLGNGITAVGQISMFQHPNAPPGVYLGAMTVYGLSAALGGKGGGDVVAFQYSPQSDTVVLNANAASLNTPGLEFGFNWGRDGTYAVVARLGGVVQALAATPGGVLGAPVALAGAPAGYIDPCPSTIGGKRVLFYDDPAGGLAYRTHDVATATLTGPTVAVTAVPGPGGNVAQSPWPMVGADGDAEALLAAEANGSYTESDWNWQGDLNPATPRLVQQPTPGTVFESNGCEAAGRIYMAQASAAGYRVVQFDVVGLLGDTIRSAGDRLDLTAFAPGKAQAGPTDVTVFAVSAAFAASPLALPGIGGALGLDLAGLVVLGQATHNYTSGRGVLTLNTPPLPVGTIPVQGFTSIAGGPLCFTSTAVVTIVP